MPEKLMSGTYTHKDQTVKKPPRKRQEKIDRSQKDIVGLKFTGMRLINYASTKRRKMSTFAYTVASALKSFRCGCR